jgi:hypothetical protein
MFYERNGVDRRIIRWEKIITHLTKYIKEDKFKHERLEHT